MKHLATIIIVALTFNCFGQQFQFDKTKISSQTKAIVTKIEKENRLMGSIVGNGGIRPKQFDNFTELQKVATNGELQELTNHPNGVVRCYSFWALTYDTSVNLLPIIIKHIPDDEKVSTMFGCIVSSEKVGDFFISLATPQYVDLDSKKLTPNEFNYLDSLLIYTPNKLYAKENAINRARLSEASYERVRELVLKENNQSALVTLAKFKRKQDIQLILNNEMTGERYGKLFFTYKAISEFPDNAFLPLLERSLYEAIDKGASSTDWRELYKAIASFKNDAALQLLKVPFTQTKHENIRQYHIDFIFAAVHDFYAPVYDELLWAMWESEKKINTKVFKLLYPKNPDKAFLLTKKTIQNADDFYYFNTGSYSEDEEKPVNLLAVMLDTVLVRDRPYAIEQINKNIREINVHQFPTFADKALKLGDTSFVSALFDRLKTEDNAHIYLKATEVLIALKDKEINKRIVEVAKINPALRKDWGGKEFAKLLKDNGIE
ncbi:hypothetical protein [Niastella populi]|uniref:Uncharacterized protein n=1 Tax=Niastella populi TaxID=550983 RepID=A0A1V9GDH1_9BACT|nr:hypothetical protein [Niastella populi]OQP68476.1 hypothetical protein A4R26_01330 [Niastella populi]